MPADGLTKALPKNKWSAFLDHLNLIERTGSGNHYPEVPLKELQEKLEQLTM
jgi:hypothetical protein